MLSLRFKLVIGRFIPTLLQLCLWLQGNGFGQYVDSFKRHRMDGEAFLQLTEQDLKNELEIHVSFSLNKEHKYRFIARWHKITGSYVNAHIHLH